MSKKEIYVVFRFDFFQLEGRYADKITDEYGNPLVKLKQAYHSFDEAKSEVKRLNKLASEREGNYQYACQPVSIE